MTKRCPHCQQTIPDAQRLVRTCYDCKLPITRHAKWTWAERANALTCVHRHCDNPESYNPPGDDPRPHAPLFDTEAAA